MEHDIIILKKILNSALFLGKYPIIDRVHVDQHGKGIDIVLIPNDSKKYWETKKEIHSYIWSITKMAGVNVKYGLNIYP
jgi:hypothetical protein